MKSHQQKLQAVTEAKNMTNEQCPKCKSYNLTVYWFNSKSYRNDYVCRDCKECFAFSKIQKKFYRLSKARQKELLILTFQKK